MKGLKRKTTQGVKKSNETKIGMIKNLKLTFLLCCLAVFFYAYANWQKLMDKLDSKPISAFILTGTPTFTTYDDIRDAVLKMGDLKGFFGQDIDAVREQIETMPWIKGAVVRKIWPDKLSIALAEHTPIAIWNDAEFLSNDGAIFQLPFDKLKEKNLPHLSGPDYQSAKVLQAWNQVYLNLKEKGLALKAIAIDDRGAWQIVLDNNLVLKLGRGEWKAKLDRFVTIYPQIEIPENKKLSYVDLRYSVGAAVGFSEADIN
ncbi:cell division protein FtsQ/DivIB [Pasteurella multocida]|uniref:cell division protein FtsQ/DivIB n=1 Tax=Pasteurella multocida TaxID=747 RepID=UPI000D3C4982|nr:cell division protein FtsQ/DivIB [Pasteurella multocida]AWB53380.1 cell division protein FtsQ [Pasteurella multocida]MCL7786968.1 cell division protein FtsQ/DivIB [Pasteurella multocida]MCL7795690.1 cell division protein FtsQ/DivIB [Pasteurella multocida]URI01760.1 cell division protein FtsQ/DivIB [Pasteurella multocida]WRK08470.1 cell division protein FtsQ/DivIB [Pasteurella multocida]